MKIKGANQKVNRERHRNYQLMKVCQKQRPEEWRLDNLQTIPDFEESEDDMPELEFVI